MGKLKVLPAGIANMIAAGEVVQRPASVVKELVENAVDAGADQITVVITDSGRTLIQVIDNGCGMSPVDATLCFERHATSKIAGAEDLEQILTYGFRGEALPSIAAVAEVTLKTRRAQDDAATQVRISDGGKVTTSSVESPQGSNFAVRNLFYNTPARRKFLKSESVEFKHIVEEFTRIAIPHPEIAFTLMHNGREVLVLRKAKSLKYRITDVLGTGVASDLVDLQAETSVVRITGFAGRPGAARKTQGNQFLFVGGRYFRSPYLHKAVMKAYEELVPEGAAPPYFIFLEVDPHSIDVNIHPTKTEIKFEDDNVIFQILYACVHETLGRNSFGGSIDFDAAAAPELPQLSRSFEEYKGLRAPEVSFDPSYDPFGGSGPFGSGPFGSDPFGSTPFGGTAPSGPSGSDRDFTPGRHTDPNPNYGVLFEERTLPSARLLIVKGKYILTPAASGLMVVSVRRARERILYEQTLAALSGQAHVTQTALFPVTVQVGVAERLLFDDNALLLKQMGFEISPLGDDSLVVGGVPEGYSCEPGKVESAVRDLVPVLSDSAGLLPEMMMQNLAEKMALLGAGGADDLTDPLEARRLVDTLFACSSPEFTSTGRRIVSILPLEELDKRF